MGASVGVVITVAEQLANLHSLDTREQVTKFLSTPAGDQLGLDVPGVLLGWRITLMVVAGLATVAAVLGYHALQRSQRARAGLAVVAVPIFLGGLVTGGFLTSVVAGATLLLWLGPSRDYFAGVTPRQPAAARSRWPSPPASESSEPTWPPPTGAPEHAPREASQAAPGPPVARPAPSARMRTRPDAVVWACVVTWAMCAVVATVMAVTVALVVADTGTVLDELRAQGSTLAGTDAAELRQATYAGAAVVGLWTLLAAVLAGFAYRGASWARLLLLVSAAVAGVVCLVAVVTSVLMVLPAAGCLAVVIVLNRPEARAWFAGR